MEETRTTMTTDSTLESLAKRNRDFAKRIVDKHRIRRNARSRVSFVFFRRNHGNRSPVIRRLVNRIARYYLWQLSASFLVLVNTSLVKQLRQHIAKTLQALAVMSDAISLPSDRRQVKHYFYRTGSFKQGEREQWRSSPALPPADNTLTRFTRLFYSDRSWQRSVSFQPNLPQQSNRVSVPRFRSDRAMHTSNRFLTTLFATTRTFADTLLQLKSVYGSQPANRQSGSGTPFFHPLDSIFEPMQRRLREKGGKPREAGADRHYSHYSVQKPGNADHFESAVVNKATSALRYLAAINLFNAAIHQVSGVPSQPAKDGPYRFMVGKKTLAINRFPTPDSQGEFRVRAKSAIQSHFLDRSLRLFQSRTHLFALQKATATKLVAEPMGTVLSDSAPPFPLLSALLSKATILRTGKQAGSNTTAWSPSFPARRLALADNKPERWKSQIRATPMPVRKGESRTSLLFQERRQTNTIAGRLLQSSKRYVASLGYKSPLEEEWPAAGSPPPFQTAASRESLFWRRLKPSEVSQHGRHSVPTNVPIHEKLQRQVAQSMVRSTMKAVAGTQQYVLWPPVHKLLAGTSLWQRESDRISRKPAPRHSVPKRHAFAKRTAQAYPALVSRQDLNAGRTQDNLLLKHPERQRLNYLTPELLPERRRTFPQPKLEPEPLVFKKSGHREQTGSTHENLESTNEQASKHGPDKTEMREAMKQLGAREIHSIAEKVFGLLEKRIDIEKDRRGIR